MPDNSKMLKWISKYGGPLLLLSSELLPFWEGSAVPSNGRVVEARFRWAGPGTLATDYDKACDVADDYIGLIEINTGKGLVLGDEPLLTAWYPDKNSKRAGAFIRWMHADDEQSVLRALDQALSAHDIWQTEDFTFPVGNHPLCLFGATFAGSELEPDDCLTIELDAGIYSIATAIYKPDTRTAVVLHHLAINA
jgi:hypothetical protein